METKVFEQFTSLADFNKKTASKNVYIEITNGWFIPVTKKAIKLVHDSMKREKVPFMGEITYLQNDNVQVRIPKIY